MDDLERLAVHDRTRKELQRCQQDLHLRGAERGLLDWFCQSLYEDGLIMDTKHEQHLSEIKAKFCDDVDRAYRRGNAEHGGFILDKVGLIDEAIKEAVDQYVYLVSVKEQLLRKEQA